MDRFEAENSDSLGHLLDQPQRQSAKAKLCIFSGLGNSLLAAGLYSEAVQALEKSVKVPYRDTVIFRLRIIYPS